MVKVLAVTLCRWPLPGMKIPPRNKAPMSFDDVAAQHTATSSSSNNTTKKTSEPKLPDPEMIQIGYGDFADFSWYEKNTVKEYCLFFSKLLIQRTEIGIMQTVLQDKYACHCHVRRDGLGCVVITDLEYPRRIAYHLLNKSCKEYFAHLATIKNRKPTDKLPPFPILETKIIPPYQNPKQVDRVSSIQITLDETRVQICKTIDQLLEREEDLNKLVEKSADLSDSAKHFYTVAKSQNNCCILI